MKIFILVIAALLICIPNCFAKGYKTVCFNKFCINAEVADTDSERAQGLMFRDSLTKDSGMFFIFSEEGLYGFWMKNMKVPLDMVWLDKDYRIVDIKENIPVCEDSCGTIYPQDKFQYVLEVNAGFVQEHFIKKGDLLIIKDE